MLGFGQNSLKYLERFLNVLGAVGAELYYARHCSPALRCVGALLRCSTAPLLQFVVATEGMMKRGKM